MSGSKQQKQQMHQTHIDIPEGDREQLCALLNAQLADTFDLYSQTKQAHWNVKGTDFIQLHELFDMLAMAVLPYVDMLAERVTALGGTAFGTVRMSGAASSLEEYPADAILGQAHLENLVERYSAYGASTRAAIEMADDKYNDAASADLFTEITREIDKDLYFLESHLQSM